MPTVIVANDFPVLEVFIHNHFEPWAIFFNADAKVQAKVLLDAEWMLKPLRYRMGKLSDWGGVEMCFRRMNKVYQYKNN